MLRNVLKIIYIYIYIYIFCSWSGVVLKFYNIEKLVTSPSRLFGNMLYTGPAAGMLPRLMTMWQQTWRSS